LNISLIGDKRSLTNLFYVNVSDFFQISFKELFLNGSKICIGVEAQK
jgi:hypothetical protein